MALSAVDHFLLADGQREHEEFLRNLSLEESGLWRQLADAKAGCKAYDVLMQTILDAYQAGDHDRLHSLLSDRDVRIAVYNPVYDEVYQQMLKS